MVFYLYHSYQAVLTVQAHLLLHFLCFLTLFFRLENQGNSSERLEPFFKMYYIDIAKLWKMNRHLSFAVALLLGTLMSEGFVGRDLFSINGFLKYVFDTWLIFRSTAQRRLHDQIHVTFMLQVQSLQVFYLFIRAFILLLKVQDVLQCDLKQRRC